MNDNSDTMQLLQRPQSLDRAAWRAYWEARGQPWRTEPEISGARQEELASLRSLPVSVDEGMYPFSSATLDRADVEWLLATHDDGRGPVDIRDWRQLARKGIDLRGAILRGANLSRLPLARTIGGLSIAERLHTPEIKRRAAVHLEDAILNGTHFEESELYMAHLEGADLYKAHLEGASLRKAHLEGASLRHACVGGAILRQEHDTLPMLESGDDSRYQSPAKERLLLPTDLRAIFSITQPIWKTFTWAARGMASPV